MDPYSTLGISHSADREAIRDAYRAKAKLYHPDVSELPDAQERFIQATQAYDLLSDPVKRARYDRLVKARQGPARAKHARQRHEQDLRRGRARAEKRAASFSKMGYEQFDREFFAETASFYGPKMLGCFGIFLAEAIVFLLCLFLAIRFGLPKVLLVIPLFAFFPVGAWFSTNFDAWHERWRARKRQR